MSGEIVFGEVEHAKKLAVVLEGFDPADWRNTCMSIAPTSEVYHENMRASWGGVATLFYVLIPVLITISAILIFISECHFLQKHARRKRVRYTLYWILGIYPAGICCFMIALFIPRSISYMEFAVDVWVAFAINKLFSLVLMIHGGRRRFTQECFEAKANAIPCCCLCCLPVVHNNIFWAKFMKWGIIQFCFMNVIIGFISIILYCDVAWVEVVAGNHFSKITPDNYFGVIRLVSTITCIYAANMFKKFQQSKMLDAEFDRKHKLNWKFNSVLLIVFIRGIQTLIFASLGDPKLQLIPCKVPLNWQLNMKVVESAVVIFEFFLLSIFARASFARLDDLRLIQGHIHLPLEESDEEEEAHLGAKSLDNKNYENQNQTGEEIFEDEN